MKLFGKTAKLSELAKIIMSEDIDELERRYSSGLDLDEPFNITEHIIVEPPIILALSENKTKVIKWLLSKKVKLNNKKYPVIHWACANCDTEILELIVKHGANVNQKNSCGWGGMDSAIDNKRYESMIFLLENGYKIEKDSKALKQAVDDKKYPAIKILLENGVNPNFIELKSSGNNATAIAVAVRNNDIETVKLLLKHGADITIADKQGERPFNIAFKNKNTELIELIKSLEPEEWHDEEQKLIHLKTYNIPDKLLEILKSKKRRMKIDHPNLSYIEFNSIVNLREIVWKKRKYLDLLCEVDGYDEHGFLIWNPEKECLASIDYEHGQYRKLSSVDTFLKDPAKQIDKLWKEPRY